MEGDSVCQGPWLEVTIMVTAEFLWVDKIFKKDWRASIWFQHEYIAKWQIYIGK